MLPTLLVLATGLLLFAAFASVFSVTLVPALMVTWRLIVPAPLERLIFQPPISIGAFGAL